jgi:hypothetical protein
LLSQWFLELSLNFDLNYTQLKYVIISALKDDLTANSNESILRLKVTKILRVKFWVSHPRSPKYE